MSKINELFSSELKVVNLGLESFASNLADQAVPVLQIGWTPPARGNADMLDLLTRFKALTGRDQ